MLGKRSRPSVRRVPEPIIPGDRTAFSDIVSSPTSPVPSKIRSPNGWKNRDSGGVGLAIVAALDKASSSNNEIRVKFVVGSLNLSRSDPIPISSTKNNCKNKGGFHEVGWSESSTLVTSRVSNKSTFTRVYCEGSECGGEFHGSEFDERLRNMGIFFASPPRFTEEIPGVPMADFLSSCYLCRKKLHGKDIYMYRGEKAFCSTECRHRQIVSDERKEKCGSKASKPYDSSLYSASRLFTPGVVAA